ncbi:M20 family metallopeptidase [Mariniblastus fucicola]|uniref:N-formyl-4-amino-5-aminomethyl-2-methylpyrimidine deformylase n=1 Tax=Mariniblastus fucicola TaxID=980251 RepID=A0A5B9P753_9BACT|nr:M20/M25/M40 family metallo-hydrolase [Mariniblastus fucicola]QEG20770.1 N-formyl-4-amino-5-aminomethyl-2-methylpyrimidine deformylase [Mariniblastus fucicola]
MIPPENFRAAIEQQSDSLIDFTSKIVATPSLSGEEGDVAALVVTEMKRLDYDEVWTDEVGNIVGKISGGNGPSVMLNGHMDVVDPGPKEGWLFPAFSGEVVGDELWGRGSVDMKGPVAAMIHGGSLFKKLGARPPGDILMTVAVMEEIGGLGSQFLATHTTADIAIVGEPSRNELRLGHRGRIELQVRFFGRSAHASAPQLGINPHYAAAEFLQKLEGLSLQSDPVLGEATIAPTLYLTDQQSANVIPSEATVYLDWRNVPSESRQHAVALIESLIGDLSGAGHESAEVKVTEQPRLTYTGVSRDFASVFPPFATSESSTIAKAAFDKIEACTGKPASPDVWQFATDGGHLALAGMQCVGFGPGDDRLAHTNQERISITELKTAAATYAPLALALAKAVEN